MASRRPPNRKARIRSVASELFAQRGFHNVSVQDVADALEITPSALYYHYRNKQDLLLHAVLDGLDSVDARIREAHTLDEVLRSLAALVAGPRGVLSVWEREARHLEGEQREQILTREGELAAALVPLLQHDRPELSAGDAELLAWAVFGAIGGRARQRPGTSRRRDEDLTYRLASAAARCPLMDDGAHTGSGADISAAAGPLGASGLRPSRREQVLAEAIRLFDERGYQSITMADVGEAAGIVASGVYRHFPSKADLLITAMNQGGDRLRAGADQAVAQARDPREALRLLLESYITVTLTHRHLMGLLSHERDQLPDKERTALRRFQSDYVGLWSQALDAVTPGRDAAERRAVVSTVHSMAYFVARSAPTDRWPDVIRHLTELGMAIMLSTDA